MCVFKPFPFLKSGHLQTIVGSLGFPPSDPPSENTLVDLGDGDKIYFKTSTPKDWTPDQGIVILVHGMAGSDQSHYMLRMSNKLYTLGIKVVRMNMRGCGELLGLAKKPHYAGASHDLLKIVETIHTDYPETPIKIIGFSLGGNVLLKMLGELKHEVNNYNIIKGIAVCPPADLESCAKILSQPNRRLYDKFYVKSLLTLVAINEKAIPTLEKANLPKKITLFKFDDLFTAPRWGFSSALDYYRTCSAYRFTADIEVPCDILYAKDDPFIDCKAIDTLSASNKVRKIRIDHGGHMGFLGFTKGHGIRWLDQTLLSLLK